MQTELMTNLAGEGAAQGVAKNLATAREDSKALMARRRLRDHRMEDQYLGAAESQSKGLPSDG
jgi:hypothetical protein